MDSEHPTVLTSLGLKKGLQILKERPTLSVNLTTLPSKSPSLYQNSNFISSSHCIVLH